MGHQALKHKGLNLTELLKPHSKALVIGLVAVMGEIAANLLEPWPLKIVFDNVLRAKPTHGWLNAFILRTIGESEFAILGFAVATVLAIAALGAVSSYIEKYFS